MTATTRRPPDLDPLGAACQTLRERSGPLPAPSAAEPTGPEGPGPVAAPAAGAAPGSRAAVPPELALFAWELARLAHWPASGPGPAQARALEWLILASLLSMQQGSTRLPLEGPAAERDLCALLESAGAGAADIEATLALARGLAARATETPLLAGAGGLVGPAGSPLPLWMADGALGHHRLGTLEARLCERLVNHVQQARLPSEPEVASAEAALLRVAGPARRSPRAAATTSLAGGLVLAREQRDAVAAAASHPLVLISGGPGTGKTSIVVTILRLLRELDVPPQAIALAAPTGKAAHRLEDSVRKSLLSMRQLTLPDRLLLQGLPSPTTLHRLLGYMPGGERFRHHENNRLSHRVVIVDEASMVDLALMEQLVRALSPAARLVLLGDADQLPSVEPGAVFRDLLGEAAPLLEKHLPGRCGAVRLVHSYRMDPSDPEGRAILGVARLLREGRAPRALEAGAASSGADSAPVTDEAVVVRRARPQDLGFSGVEWLPAARADERTAFLDAWYARQRAALPDRDRLVARTYRFDAHGVDPEQAADLEALFRHAEATRLLCLTHRESPTTGATGINAYLHSRAAAHTAATDELDGGGASGATGATADLVPGEPVLMRRNDYGRQLFNGDQEMVIRVAHPGMRRGRPMVVFPRVGQSGPIAPTAGAAPPLAFAAFPLETLRGEVTLCHANTVHAAQGSEFDHVALVLPERELPLLTRELLYTAVTRARRSVTLVGSLELLHKGARRRLERHSGLAALLGRRLARESQPSDPRSDQPADPPDTL